MQECAKTNPYKDDRMEIVEDKGSWVVYHIQQDGQVATKTRFEKKENAFDFAENVAAWLSIPFQR